MNDLRDALVQLAKDFDTAEGGTLVYRNTKGLRCNAHDQIMLLLAFHPETLKGAGDE